MEISLPDASGMFIIPTFKHFYVMNKKHSSVKLKCKLLLARLCCGPKQQSKAVQPALYNQEHHGENL